MMKTLGVRALRENPGVLSKSAAAGEYVLLTNRNDPVSLAVPFDDELVRAGVHVSLAVKLFEEEVLTLSKAARMARLDVEDFLAKLAALGVPVVRQDADDLDADLNTIDG